jgi:predicted SAM-dependent methyltransferase
MTTASPLAWIQERLARRRLAAAVRAARVEGRPLRLVLGSGGIADPGWIATDARTLDVTDPSSWARLVAPASVDALLAEHVWEHLEPEEGRRAAANCLAVLRPGGYLRLAVPDGFHADPQYRAMVRPGGTGAGADDHRVLYDVRSLTALLEGVGFRVDPIEYFDEEGRFVRGRLDPRRGVIWRSLEFDERNAGGEPRCTSLIVDAVKPGAGEAG